MTVARVHIRSTGEKVVRGGVDRSAGDSGVFRSGLRVGFVVFGVRL